TFNLMQRRIREQVSQRARMLGAVSHDLRTPLSRLKLRLEQIDDMRLQGQMRHDLDDMIGMLDATLSYLHEQRTGESRQWLDVQALVQSLSENAQDQGADVQCLGQSAPLQVQPMALRSCLNNLIDNALRYAGHNATVTVGVHALDDNDVELYVEDNGPGVPDDVMPRLGERFFRAPGTAASGTGLGLAIAHEAVEHFGGRLSFLNRPGGGLKVAITLPLLKAP
ncbi:MAG: HAMP domain-containing sensor histidine kinase, partial [Stenotrophomonas maltophilia]|nr:HAMP domain-containing sensor histidine kinase [Stenotrophomonas maltophilia]